ncbi:MAG: isoprenyl transferase [Bacteroidales bacterium]|nr:isoprenyl transferase [Bacteroidales bacterium]
MLSMYKEQIDLTKVPKHVAIIMDGNGRWAKEKGLDRVFGHKEGAAAFSDVTEAAAEIGVKYLTAYAFSTENWNRPQAEVEALMSLLVSTIEKETDKLLRNDIRLCCIGDLSRLPKPVNEKLQGCIERTAHCQRMTIVLALSYSAKWEILQAVKSIASEVKNGNLNVEDICDDVFASHLNTNGIPDPDLLIRTSGESRISNFLLWQIAYSELYFTTVNWPDFRKEEFFKAICDYQKRERRFGKTSEQIK